MYTTLSIALVQLLAGAPDTKTVPDPAAIVQRQDDAYNAHDLEAFLKFYAPDAELYELPDKLLAKGTVAIRERYTGRLAEPGLHADITQRIVIGDNVIDHERIRRTFPEGPGLWDVVAIYEVKGGLITRVWFILGAKTLDKK